jgi:hypothetical protein
MEPAVWGFIGVIVGVAVTGIVTIRAEIIRADRTEKLDRWKRVDDRQLARDQFQRQTLLDLQDAIAELSDIEVRMVTGQHRGATGHEVLDRYSVISWRIHSLNSRVSNEQVRESVGALMQSVTALSRADKDAREEPFDRVGDNTRTFLVRSGTLIRERFEEPSSG